MIGFDPYASTNNAEKLKEDEAVSQEQAAGNQFYLSPANLLYILLSTKLIG
jgi:hypothetical protein